LVLSLLVSRLLSSSLSASLAGAIPQDAFAEMAFFGDFIQKLVQGLVQSCVALLLFGIFFFLFLVVFKMIWNHVKKEALVPRNKNMKWGGLGVRALDALVVALLLLIPLYGLLSTYAPPIASLITATQGADAEAAQYCSEISGNGMVSLYKAGPLAWVRSPLSRFRVGEIRMDLGKIAKVSGEAIDKVGRLNAAENREETIEAVADLSKFLREEVIEEEWFYDAASQAKQAMSDALETLNEDEQEVAGQVLAVFDLPREEFQENGVAVLDFTTYILESGAINVLETGDLEDLPEDFSEKLSDFLREGSISDFRKELAVNVIQEAFLKLEKENERLESAVTEEERNRILKEMKEDAAKRAEEFLDEYLPKK